MFYKSSYGNADKLANGNVQSLRKVVHCLVILDLTFKVNYEYLRNVYKKLPTGNYPCTKLKKKLLEIFVLQLDDLVRADDKDLALVEELISW